MYYLFVLKPININLCTVADPRRVKNLAMKKLPLEPENYYHIFNHANGREDFFYDKYDYQNFLNRYIKYIVPIADTFAYCLMPNHFHFFVQIKGEGMQKLQGVNDPRRVDPRIISYRFSHFFNSYAQSYNKKYSRKGSIFISNFKRKAVNTEKYFIKMIHYIHSNPVNDGFTSKIQNWEFSSYKIILSDADTFINRKMVLDYFGDKENFIFVHANPMTLQGSL